MSKQRDHRSVSVRTEGQLSAHQVSRSARIKDESDMIRPGPAWVPDFRWTDEKVQELRDLWPTGLSTYKIGARIGTTGAAVCGKARRIGLPFRDETVTNKVNKSTMIRARSKKRKPNWSPDTVTNEALSRGQTTTGHSATQPLSKPAPRATEQDGLDAAQIKSDGVKPVVDLDIPVETRKTISTLTPSCCRWPCGDPLQPDFYFCGMKKVSGLSYCERHAHRAFQPPSGARRDVKVRAEVGKSSVTQKELTHA